MCLRMGSAYDSIEKERMGKDNLMSWYEQTDDFGNEKAISVLVVHLRDEIDSVQ